MTLDLVNEIFILCVWLYFLFLVFKKIMFGIYWLRTKLKK